MGFHHLGSHNEIYRIKVVEKAGVRNYGFHNGHLAVGATNQNPKDRRDESSKYVHAYRAASLGLDATSTWIFEYCGDETNPYDYYIKLYDPHDRSSVLGGYLTQSALDGQDIRDDGSAYVHLYYPSTNTNLDAHRWMVIPTEVDGQYQICFKNERKIIRNPACQKLLLCLHNFWQESPIGAERCDPRDYQSAYAHVRIEDDNVECSTWSLEVTNWRAVLSSATGSADTHYHCHSKKKKHQEEEGGGSVPEPPTAMESTESNGEQHSPFTDAEYQFPDKPVNQKENDC